MSPLFVMYLVALAVLAVLLAWNAWDYLRISKATGIVLLALSASLAAQAESGGSDHRGGGSSGSGTGGADHGANDDVSDPGHVSP